MTTVRLPCGVEIWDVGPGLNAIFDDIYSGRPFSPAALEREAFAYFSVNPNPDPFAFNFAELGLPHRTATMQGLKFWETVIALMEDWERANPGSSLHKGGAYYFAAIRDISMGNLDRGFLYMHKAAAEDERSYGPGRTPAVAFITLDPRMQNQSFKRQVEIYSDYLRRRLASYRKFRNGKLTLPRLRASFSRHHQLREPLFALAYSVARVEQATGPGTEPVMANPLAAVIRSRIVLDLALLVEELLRDQFDGAARARRPGHFPTFFPLAREYADQRGLAVEAALPKLTRFGTSFEPTMRALLAGTSPIPIGGTPTPRDLDLAIVGGLRNHSAHGIARSTMVATRFDELVRHTFYVLFAVIEDCYP